MKRWNWRAAALGAASGMMTVVVLTAAGAGLMAKRAVDPAYMGYFAAGILVLSGLAGGLSALIGGGGETDALIGAAGELVVLVGINGVLCGGEMEGFWVTALAVMGGCGAAMLLRMNRRSSSGRRRRRRRK